MSSTQHCSEVFGLNEAQEDRILEALFTFRHDVMEEIKILRQMMKKAFDKSSLVSSQYVDYSHCDETDLRRSSGSDEEENVPSLQGTFESITGMLTSFNQPSSNSASIPKEVFSSKDTLTSNNNDVIEDDSQHSSNKPGICQKLEDTSGLGFPTSFSGELCLTSAIQSNPCHHNPTKYNAFVSGVPDYKPCIPERKLSKDTHLMSRKSLSIIKTGKKKPRKLRLNDSMHPPPLQAVATELVFDMNSLEKSKSSGRVMKLKCLICGKLFTRKSVLNDHIRTHTGDKPFKCTVCNKSFITQNALKYHTRTHTGEKPYSCLECGKTFADGSNLRVHSRIHTGEKPYTCTLCDEPFTYLNCFKRHMRRMHPSHLSK